MVVSIPVASRVTVRHQYALLSKSYTITVTATDEDGTYHVPRRVVTAQFRHAGGG
jgi:hypothetical protein